jgi:hypothetical protein
MINIELNCGRVVNVDGFHFGYTYEEYLICTPNEETNMKIFDKISYPSDWGQRKYLKIRPKEEDIKNRLQPVYYSVWLHSESINLDSNGSELVVTWLGDLPNGKTIENIIQRGLAYTDWNKNAEDFYF